MLTQIMKLLLSSELERLRFLMTDTDLPSFNAYEKMDATVRSEAVNAIRDEVCTKVFAAVCSATPAPVDIERFPVLLWEESNLRYLQTMARVNQAPLLDKFDSINPEHLEQYKAGLTMFNDAVTKVLETHAAAIPRGKSNEVEIAKRRMLVNNHKWMTHGPVALRIWPAKHMLPYMLRNPLMTLDAMMSKIAPALNEVSYFLTALKCD